MEQNTLATELLHMLKQSAKRWFIAFTIMVVVEVLTIIGFLWYISLPTEETSIEQTMDDVEDSTATQLIGGEYNGKDETKGNSEKENNSYQEEKKITKEE